MAIQRQVLADYLADLLQIKLYQDYSPNGLQVEGRAQIQRIVTGVTACQALLEQAVALQADAILVHHGYFWKGEAEVITGMKKRRLQTLLQHDINLFGYHLPLDCHPELGNNRQLGELLGLQPQLKAVYPDNLLMQGDLATPLAASALMERIEQRLGRGIIHCSGHARPIRSVAWCTGGGQRFIDQAAALGVDAFISGEISEPTVHSARELGIDYFALGHHATERYGIQALGEHLAQQFALQHQFIEIDNPA